MFGDEEGGQFFLRSVPYLLGVDIFLVRRKVRNSVFCYVVAQIFVMMSLLNFAPIADYLDCSIDYLVGRTDNPEVNR